jgi:3-dehydroquinate synthase
MNKTEIEILSWEEIDKTIRNIQSDQIILIIDQNLWQLYTNNFKALLSIENKQVILWKSPDGEKVKNIKDYEACIEFLIEKGVHRNAHVVTIGGGAVSDFAGFVASTVLRGISWSVIPTTLLSMIDASIGGKVAINSNLGKNLIGAFHLPDRVLIDLSFLNTLEKVEVQSGKGELLKYCFLDKDIYETTLKEGCSAAVIEKCARYKQKITEEDFEEGGKRKVLNFGHTFGHAIERIYNIPHGEAVIWGSVIILLLYGSRENLLELKKLLSVMDIEANEPPWYQKSFPLDDVMNYVNRDKKKQSNKGLDLILVNEIGKPEIVNHKIEDIEKTFKENIDELRNFSVNGYE